MFGGVVLIAQFFACTHSVHLPVLTPHCIARPKVKLRSVGPMPLVLMISGYLRARFVWVGDSGRDILQRRNSFDEFAVIVVRGLRLHWMIISPIFHPSVIALLRPHVLTFVHALYWLRVNNHWLAIGKSYMFSRSRPA